MKKITIFMTVFLLSISQLISAQQTKTDANLIGDVQCNGEHVPFIKISIDGTTIATNTDATGHYQITNLPEGTYTVRVSGMGYKSSTQKLEAKKDITNEIKFKIEEDLLNLEELVITADRAESKRTEAPVIVNTISDKLLTSTTSITLGEGLNFSPGLRLENDCQNCGFSQVRMNGMEGSYSQILINSRPIFSGLAGIYGLELIPSNMIKKIEVVRGGGSALYGSNAIAGTINIIMKDPTTNSYEVGTNYTSTGVGTNGEPASDYSVNFNTSVVSDDRKSGVSVYGFSREREMYDDNNDGYSEIAALKNLTFGARAFHKFGDRDKLSIDYFGINEQREGGNKLDYTLHERDIAEAVTHDMKVAGLTYERFFRKYDMLSLFSSGQFLNRDSYYGAEQSLTDYGNSKGKTFNFGAQYKAQLKNASLIVGIENTSDYLLDKKLGYLDIDNAIINADTITSIPHTDNTTIANQASITTGAFAQYDLKLNKVKLSLGGRFDHYDISDEENNGQDKTGGVFSPRASLMYNISDVLQARGTYSQGYRAPQIFDEDLHIETSGLRQVIHENDPNLKQETSQSYSASLDFNKLIGKTSTGFLIEGFYTQLDDAFANEMSEPDANDIVTYTRINSSGATVKGINMELRLKVYKSVELTSGFTLQTSEYAEIQDWGNNKFLRTPNKYGFFAIDWDFHKGFCFTATGNYTGSMDILYEGEETKNVDVNNIVNSDSFVDLGAKLSYTTKLAGSKVQFFGGIKNIINSYQTDFDSGINRDPAYIYGPVAPRTIYLGLKFGNIL